MLAGRGAHRRRDLGREAVVAEWKRRRREVFVPLVYHPGDLAEVDFFEVLVDMAGARRKAWMLVVRLMHSGRDYARIYPTAGPGLFSRRTRASVRAFRGGASATRLRQSQGRSSKDAGGCGAQAGDAVRSDDVALSVRGQLLSTTNRPRQGRRRGPRQGHSLQHLVPIPSGEDLEEINRALLERLDARVDERFAAERGRMLPLPTHAFRARATHLPSVSRRSLITVEGAVYSVPCAWAGLDVTAHVGADDVRGGRA